MNCPYNGRISFGQTGMFAILMRGKNSPPANKKGRTDKQVCPWHPAMLSDKNVRPPMKEDGGRTFAFASPWDLSGVIRGARVPRLPIKKGIGIFGKNAVPHEYSPSTY